MTRLTPTQPAVAPFGLPTGGMCCGDAVRGGTAFGTGPWAGVYRLAYERAAAQVAADDRRRRLLGHVLPSVN